MKLIDIAKYFLADERHQACNANSFAESEPSCTNNRLR